VGVSPRGRGLPPASPSAPTGPAGEANVGSGNPAHGRIWRARRSGSWPGRNGR